MKRIVIAISLALLGSLWLAAAEGYRFRPSSERESFDKRSPYRKWVEEEGIPLHEGYAIQDLRKVELKPWKRLGPGVKGAYLYLEGAGGIVDAFIFEIEAGKQTNPERHLFEEQLLVLSGQGETLLWQGDSNKKQTLPWRKGTMFSPPLNTWHQHINRGNSPAIMVAVSNLPLVLDIYRDPTFVYNNPHVFAQRYSGEPNYFDPEISRDYGPDKRNHSLSIVNIVRDVWTVRLFPAGQGIDDYDRHFILSHNTMGTHIETFPVGTYERAHRHGPGSSIILLNGSGYTLMWPQELGEQPFSSGKGDKVVRIDWREGTFLIPPTQWYHQHFNTGKEPARFVKLGTRLGNELYRMTSGVLAEWGRHTINYTEEDPKIREIFEAELRKNGTPLRMPSREELARMEKEAKLLLEQ